MFFSYYNGETHYATQYAQYLTFKLPDGRTIADTLNTVGFDAMVLGNVRSFVAGPSLTR